MDEAGRQQSQDQGAPLHCGPGATHEYFEAFDSYLPGALPLLAGVHLDQKKVLTREAAKQVAAAAIRFTAANKYKGDCGDMRRWRPPSLISNLADRLAQADTLVLKLRRAMPVEGGFPLVVEGKTIGWIRLPAIHAIRI